MSLRRERIRSLRLSLEHHHHAEGGRVVEELSVGSVDHEATDLDVEIVGVGDGEVLGSVFHVRSFQSIDPV